MKHILLAISLIFLFSCSEKEAPPKVEVAPISLNLCNESKENIKVAVSTYKNESWHTFGWVDLVRGECKKVDAVLSKHIYVYAKGERGSTWSSKGNTFCVDNKFFDLKSDKNCEDRGYQSKNFVEVKNIEKGENTQSFSGGKTSKIDSLVIGQTMYLEGVFSDDLVQIVDIVKSKKAVKIKDEYGELKWVNSSELITLLSSQKKDLARGIGAAAIVYCLFNSDDCSENRSK